MAVTDRLERACASYAFSDKPDRFKRFWSATREDWRAMGVDLLRRWKVPTHRMGIDDVEQVMALNAWRAFEKYDPASPMTLGEFVAWTGQDMAKKAIHKARNAKQSGNRGKNPSRIPRTFSSFVAKSEGKSGDDAVISIIEAAAFRAGMGQNAPQVEEAEISERSVSVHRACKTQAERYAVSALFWGESLRDAASRLFRDPDASLRYRLGSESKARKVISTAAREIVARVGAAV